MKKSIIFLIILTIVYLIIINFISIIDFTNLNFSNKTSDEQSYSVQKIGFSDSISVSVIKNRIYGKIIQEDSNVKLYLFRTIPVPIKSNNVSFVFYHIIFLFFILIFIIAIFLIKLIRIYLKDEKEVYNE